MNIDGFNHSTADWDSIPQYYQTYRMIPMCGNLQLIFFRKKDSKDILVKPLLNEREVHLTGIKTNCFPFYHWEDIRKAWIELTDKIYLPELPEEYETE